MLPPQTKYPLGNSVSEKRSFWFYISALKFGLLYREAYPFAHQEEGKKRTLESYVLSSRRHLSQTQERGFANNHTDYHRLLLCNHSVIYSLIQKPVLIILTLCVLLKEIWLQIDPLKNPFKSIPTCHVLY